MIGEDLRPVGLGRRIAPVICRPSTVLSWTPKARLMRGSGGFATQRLGDGDFGGAFAALRGQGAGRVYRPGAVTTRPPVASTALALINPTISFLPAHSVADSGSAQ